MFPIGDDNPTRTKPVLTIALVAICVAVFFYQFMLPAPEGEAFIFRWGFIAGDLLGRGGIGPTSEGLPAWSKIFSSMFLHGDFMHIIGNMLFLWIYGNNVEDEFGKIRFLIFYLLCGVAAALTQAITDTNSGVPMIGASGAISGVLGAYIWMFPHARIRVIVMFGIITMVHLRAYIVIGLWFILQLVSAALTPISEEGGVAFWAHVGGFVAGFLLLPIFRRRQQRHIRGPWG